MKLIDEGGEEAKKKIIPEDYLKCLAKEDKMTGDMRNTMATSIYEFMKLKKIPDKAIDFAEKEKEIDELIVSMKEVMVNVKGKEG